MKRTRSSLGLLVLAAALCLLAYSVGTAQGKSPAVQAGDALRWHVVTNPGDASKTFLVDSLIGETYIFASAGDSFSWKKMDRAK